MKNKIGILLIIFSLILYINKLIFIKENTLIQNKKINNIKNNYNKIDEYIEIPRYNIKRLVKDDVSSKVLDNYYVGEMDNKNDNLIILAGHNVNLVFHKIHYLKQNDLIIFNNKTYKVYDYKEIKIDDYSYINKKYDKKTIMLITCTKDKNKRYIVLAH